MNQSKFLSNHLFSWTTPGTTRVSLGPEKWIQDKINYARNLLEEMSLKENGEAGGASRLQCKSDPERRNEIRKEDWTEAPYTQVQF